MERYTLHASIARLEYERRRYLRAYFQTLNIPLGQGQPRILAQLHRSGPSSQKELSAVCGIDESTVSRSVDRLAEAGLVQRTPDPACRRSTRVSLTPQGAAAAAKVVVAFEHEDAVLRTALGGADEKTVIATLSAMADAMAAAPPYEESE